MTCLKEIFQHPAEIQEVHESLRSVPSVDCLMFAKYKLGIVTRLKNLVKILRLFFNGRNKLISKERVILNVINFILTHISNAYVKYV